MGFETVWSREVEGVHGAAPVVRGGRATTARWGARPCVACGRTIANPRPRPSKSIADRAALLAEIAARRRRAQIAARHALEAPAPARAVVALAS